MENISKSGFVYNALLSTPWVYMNFLFSLFIFIFFTSSSVPSYEGHNRGSVQSLKQRSDSTSHGDKQARRRADQLAGGGVGLGRARGGRALGARRLLGGARAVRRLGGLGGVGRGGRGPRGRGLAGAGRCRGGAQR